MYKYILYFIISAFIETDCPDKRYTLIESPHEKGVYFKYQVSCGVYHVKEVSDTLRFEFDSMESLIKFKESTNIEYREVVIDSLKN